LADSPHIRQSGAVMKCSLDRQGSCSVLPFDRRGEHSINGERTESKSGQWLGATVATSASGSVMACAPRYVHYSVNLKRREPVGLCYLARSLQSEPVEFSPCKVKEQWGYHRLGSCQAGFAGTIARTGERFLVTAPGSFYWQGQVYSYDAQNGSHQATKDSKPEDDDTYMGV
jgi:integrin alpha 8